MGTLKQIKMDLEFNRLTSRLKRTVSAFYLDKASSIQVLYFHLQEM